MDDKTKWRKTIEDINGELSVRLVWEVSDYCARVTAYRIVGRNEDGPSFEAADAYVIRWTLNHEKAEEYFSGFVKWDSCVELDQGRQHWCEPEHIKAHCALLQYIYERAFALMGREPESPWNDDPVEFTYQLISSPE